MQIETNFIEDIREGLAHELQQLGHPPPASAGNSYDSAHQMFLDHAHAMARRISAAPREVRVSRELIALEPSLPAAIRGGLMTTAFELRHGADVSPRLSRGVKKLRGRDDLLVDWGIHHLHLGGTLDSDGFVARNDEVLFVMVRPQTAYLITVRGHGSWADDDLVEIIHANWPQEISRYRYDALRLHRRLAPTERQLTRRGGVNVGSQLLGTLPSQNHSPPGSCRRVTVISCPISPSSVQSSRPETSA